VEFTPLDKGFGEMLGVPARLDTLGIAYTAVIC
jgi:hypothetical protein